MRKLKDIQTLIQEKVFRKKSVEKIVYNDNVHRKIWSSYHTKKIYSKIILALLSKYKGVFEKALDLDGDRCGHDGGDGEFSVYDGVEAVEGVSVVVDSPAGTVRLDQTVGALHDVTVTSLVLRLRVTGQSVLHGIGELVLGVGVELLWSGDYWGGGGPDCEGCGDQRGGGSQRQCGAHGGVGRGESGVRGGERHPRHRKRRDG